MMNEGIRNVEKTMITLSEFGTRCLKIILGVDAPIERAASTN